MSLDAMDWVWTKSKSKGVGRLVLLALADKTLTTEGDCKSYGSYRFLAQRANCTQGAITEALDGLYALGELELLPDRGPMGAATYRLPLAVGHVRETRTNRSAQRSDSSTKGRNESLGSAEQQVHGSAERLGDGSHGSAEHNTTYAPRNTTSSPTDPSATAALGGGGGEHQQLQRAAAFVDGLDYDGQRPGRAQRDKLIKFTDAALADGWTEQALVKQINPGTAAVTSRIAIYLHRLKPDNLPEPAVQQRASPGLPDWCTECNDGDPAARFNPRFRYRHGQMCHCHPDHKDAAA